MANLIKGENLNAEQRQQVLAAFVHRHLNPMLKSDDEFITTHAFYFVKDGSRLANNVKHCEPAFMAD